MHVATSMHLCTTESMGLYVLPPVCSVFSCYRPTNMQMQRPMADDWNRMCKKSNSISHGKEGEHFNNDFDVKCAMHT